MNVEYEIDNISQTENCPIYIKICFRTLSIFWDEKKNQSILRVLNDHIWNTKIRKIDFFNCFRTLHNYLDQKKDYIFWGERGEVGGLHVVNQDKINIFKILLKDIC